MKALIAMLMMVWPILAQPPATPAPATPTAPATTPAPATTLTPAPAASTNSSSAASPVPSTEPALSGWIDLGYRWNTGVGGSLDTYRSIINLGSGPKFLGTDFTLTDPTRKWFDTIQVRADSWGDERSSTVHLEATKSGVYDFNADYRDFAYFNFLPSYADPLLSQGIVLDEQSFDTRRKIAAILLKIRPGHWWSPYLGWDHDSSSGTGTTVFVTDGNNYAVPNTLRDSTNLFRAGVKFERPRFHVTLEEGGTVFKSDQSLFQSPSSVNFGNFPAPVLGQTLDLTNLLAAYGIGGSSAYSKVLLTANPTPWLDIYGQFFYSQPNSNVHYQQTDAGNLYLPESDPCFISSEQEIARLPHPSSRTLRAASARGVPAAEGRLRIVDVLGSPTGCMTAGSSASTQTLMLPGTSLPLSSLLATTLASNYNQEAVDIFF